MKELGEWPRKGSDDMLYEAEQLVKYVDPCNVDAKKNIWSNVAHTLDIVYEKADAAKEVIVVTKDNTKNDANAKSTKGDSETKIETHVREENGNVPHLPRA